MIAAFLDKVFGNQQRSLLEGLEKMFSISRLEHALRSAGDWRNLPEEIRRLTDSSRKEFYQKLSSNLRIPLLDKVPVSDLSVWPTQLSFEDCERWACLPFTPKDEVAGLICLDPSVLSRLPLEFNALPLAFASWENIQLAQRESEELYLLQHGAPSKLDISPGEFDKCRSLLEDLLSEAESSGSSEIHFQFRAEAICYSFNLSDGHTAEGSIHSKLRALLLRFFRFVQSSEDFSVKFLPGSLTEVTVGRHSAERPDNILDRSAKIVLVEDDSTFTLVVKSFLEPKGYEVTSFDSGEAALRFLRKTPDIPDLLVSDLYMPGLDGLSFVEQLKKHVSLEALPVVILTSDEEPSQELKALQLGVEAFVSKNSDPRILLTQIQRLTRSKSTDRRGCEARTA